MTDPIAETLCVFWGAMLVGRYQRLTNGSEQFVYDAEYLASPSAQPISHSLPLRAESYSRHQLRPFFAGLLPEESQRDQIASYLGLDRTDDFALLKALGGECAGALIILPDGIRPDCHQSEFKPLSEDELIETIESLPLRPLLAGERGFRLSLAGAQCKLPIILREEKIALPVGNTPSTHILKPELSPWFKDIAVNEHACMSLARHLGLPVPRTTLRQVGTHPCLIVERYDREISESSENVARIHQEDFCQAMGRMPEQKYQSDGGPLVREVVRLLRSGWSTAPALDVMAFVDLLIFNALIGNADAHGKNYSMLYRGTTRRLSPGYDLVSTVYWPSLAKSPAMKIGGCDSVDAICYGHWKKMSEELSIGLAQLLRRIRQLCHDVEETSAHSLALPSECAPIIKLVQDRARRIERTVVK